MIFGFDFFCAERLFSLFRFLHFAESHFSLKSGFGILPNGDFHQSGASAFCRKSFFIKVGLRHFAESHFSSKLDFGILPNGIFL